MCPNHISTVTDTRKCRFPFFTPRIYSELFSLPMLHIVDRIMYLRMKLYSPICNSIGHHSLRRTTMVNRITYIGEYNFICQYIMLIHFSQYPMTTQYSYLLIQFHQLHSMQSVIRKFG